MLFGLGATKISRLRRYKRDSGQNVWRVDVGTERTSWRLANFSNGINTTGRTWRNLSVFIEFYKRRQVVRKVDWFTVCFAPFSCELIGGCINLAQIVNASVGRTPSVPINEIWSCRPNEESNYTHQNDYSPKTKIPT